MRRHAVQPLVVSLCHQRASLEQLGRVAVSRDGLPNMLAELTSAGFGEVVVLSTCSRTEVYTVTGGDGRAEAGRLVRALSTWSGMPRQRVEELATTLSGEAAVTHLFRVTAGLESRLVGDVDVVSQVRSAWRAARDAGTVGGTLAKVFPASIRSAQQAHARTSLGIQQRSLARRAVDVAIAGSVTGEGLDVLVVGSGHMASAACEHLSRSGHPFRVAARNPAYAARLAGDGKVCPIGALRDGIRQASVVICATSAQQHVLSASEVAGAMAGRRLPLTVVDLAVPRNVDPDVGELPGVRLVDLAGLGDQAGVGQEMAEAVAAATTLVDAAAHRLCDDLAATRAGPVIEAVRRAVESTCLEELQRHGGAVDSEAIARAAHAVAGKILHRPTLLARTAAARDDAETLLLLCAAFGVGDDQVGRSLPAT